MVMIMIATNSMLLFNISTFVLLLQSKYVFFLFSQLLDRGILCRKSIDPCDFPEFCNGMSEFCVPDMKAADLQTCNNKSSYCFGGVCQDRTKQCEDLFGKCNNLSFLLSFIFKLYFSKVSKTPK